MCLYILYILDLKLKMCCVHPMKKMKIQRKHISKELEELENFHVQQKRILSERYQGRISKIIYSNKAPCLNFSSPCPMFLLNSLHGEII